MTTETITWHAVNDELPDDDMTVLLDFEGSDPWPGYREDGKWYEPNGAEVDGVIAWADMPEGTA